MARMGWLGQQPEEVNNLYAAIELERRAESQRTYGSPEVAAQLFERALQLRQQYQPGTEYDVLDKLGKTYIQLYRYDDAARCFQEAVEIITNDYYADHPLIAPILDDWTRCCLEQGELDRAAELCKHSLDIKHKSLLPQDIHTIETERTLGEIYRRLEKYSDSESVLKQALKKVESSTIGPVEEFYYELALLYQDQAKYGEAEEYFQKALPIFAQRGGKIARFAMALAAYATLLRATERGAMAMRLDEEAQAIMNDEVVARPGGQNITGPAFFDDQLYACTILH